MTDERTPNELATLGAELAAFMRCQKHELTRLADYRDALIALEAKIATMHMDARFSAVFAMAQLHGLEYDGPNYADELARARRVLGIIRPPGA